MRRCSWPRPAARPPSSCLTTTAERFFPQVRLRADRPRAGAAVRSRVGGISIGVSGVGDRHAEAAAMTIMNTVLFACVHNAGRSQMAAAWFNLLSDPARARAISAGTDPGPRVHPEVVTAMNEVGVDLSGAPTSKLTTELARAGSDVDHDGMWGSVSGRSGPEARRLAAGGSQGQSTSLASARFATRSVSASRRCSSTKGGAKRADRPATSSLRRLPRRCCESCARLASAAAGNRCRGCA